MNHAPVSLVKKIWGLQSLLYFLALTPNCGRRMASKKIKSLDVIIIWTTDCLQHIIFTTMSGRINVSRMMNCKCVKVGMVQHKRKTTKVPQHKIYILKTNFMYYCAFRYPRRINFLFIKIVQGTDQDTLYTWINFVKIVIE